MIVDCLDCSEALDGWVEDYLSDRRIRSNEFLKRSDLLFFPRYNKHYKRYELVIGRLINKTRPCYSPRYMYFLRTEDNALFSGNANVTHQFFEHVNVSIDYLTRYFKIKKLSE